MTSEQVRYMEIREQLNILERFIDRVDRQLVSLMNAEIREAQAALKTLTDLIL